MELLIFSFLAGALTVLAPCILPLLPIVVGGAAVSEERNWRKPFVITGSLAVSVVAFTLLLKASTALLGIPAYVWQIVSGVIIVLLGLAFLIPGIWERIGARLNLTSSKLLGQAGRKKGLGGEILTGAALGPVFSSCSPTYAFVVASILPASFAVGLGYLAAYAIGLSLVLLLIAILGQQLVTKLQWAANPKGWFRRALGIIFIAVGIFVATGLDKQVQAYLVEQGIYDPISQFEQSLLPR
ncbi:MAG: cytochrome c biogenesis CcdA family protein [Candidatus Saccharimonadales bacterium]